MSGSRVSVSIEEGGFYLSKTPSGISANLHGLTSKQFDALVEAFDPSDGLTDGAPKLLYPDPDRPVRYASIILGGSLELSIFSPVQTNTEIEP